MNVTVDDLMTRTVVTVPESAVVGEVRDLMIEHDLHAVPIVDGEGVPVGIVTSSDLVEEYAPLLGIVEVMSPHVFVVPRYEGVHIPARVMRNHHIHHVIVTEHHKVVGILSSFDLLRLVEEHRFVMKNPPTPSPRGNQRV